MSCMDPEARVIITLQILRYESALPVGIAYCLFSTKTSVQFLSQGNFPDTLFCFQ